MTGVWDVSRPDDEILRVCGSFESELQGLAETELFRVLGEFKAVAKARLDGPSGKPQRSRRILWHRLPRHADRSLRRCALTSHRNRPGFRRCLQLATSRMPFITVRIESRGKLAFLGNDFDGRWMNAFSGAQQADAAVWVAASTVSRELGRNGTMRGNCCYVAA